MIQLICLNKKSAFNYLKKQDEYTEALTPLNLELILEKENATLTDYFSNLKESLLDWDIRSVINVSKLEKELNENLAKIGLKLSEKILLISSNGNDGFNIAYTRMQAIIFPNNNNQASSTNKLNYLGIHLLTHEVFHVLSRKYSYIRKPLYEIFGFQHVDYSLINDEVSEQIIINPDAINYNYFIELQFKNEFCKFVPLIYWNKNKDRFEWNDFLLLKEENSKLVPDRLVKSKKTKIKKIIKNTTYISHPEEICAEHFRLMLCESKVSDLDILNKFKRKFLEIFKQ